MRFLFGLSAMLAAALLLSACERQDAVPLDQQLYVWQRQWTPAHEAALKGSRADFSTLRVLALQAFPQAGWSRARIDPPLLKERWPAADCGDSPRWPAQGTGSGSGYGADPPGHQ